MTVDSRGVLCIAALGATLFASGTAHAHFVLTSPPSSTEQNALGDPQKAPPCGDDGTATATGMVTAYQSGQTITITIDETIYHPGHYRIALAVNDPSELPPEPEVTEGNQACGTTTIMAPPVFPVLADGVFVHNAPFGEPQSIDITLPDDVTCTNCTLQIIQFMSEHGLNVPGGCFYHHCAAISIEGGAAEASTTMPGDESGPSDDDGSTSTVPTTSGGDETDSGSEATASATDATATASATNATGVTTMGDTEADTDSAGSDEDEDGCSCSSDASRHGFAPLLLLLGLVGVRRRAIARG
jgi:MYXO-CTERM domain-containing protein